MKSKSEMEADQEEPEVPLAQHLAHHPACHFRVPVVERAKERSHDSTDDQGVVEVRNAKVRGTQLPVKGSNREAVIPVEAGNKELEIGNQCRTSSGTAKCTSPPQMVANQLKILIPVGTEITMVAKTKKVLPAGPRPTVNI